MGPNKFVQIIPRLTLTHLTLGSNLLPNAFKWDFFFKVDFLNTVEAKVIILTWYVKPNETMAINKFERSRLIFDLSAKVAHIARPPISASFSKKSRA